MSALKAEPSVLPWVPAFFLHGRWHIRGTPFLPYSQRNLQLAMLLVMECTIRLYASHHSWLPTPSAKINRNSFTRKANADSSAASRLPRLPEQYYPGFRTPLSLVLMLTSVEITTKVLADSICSVEMAYLLPPGHISHASLVMPSWPCVCSDVDADIGILKKGWHGLRPWSKTEVSQRGCNVIPVKGLGVQLVVNVQILPDICSPFRLCVVRGTWYLIDTVAFLFIFLNCLDFIVRIVKTMKRLNYKCYKRHTTTASRIKLTIDWWFHIINCFTTIYFQVLQPKMEVWWIINYFCNSNRS